MIRSGAVILLAIALGACTEAVRWRDEAPPTTAPVPVARSGEHLVRSGDTVYSIALRHDLDFRELAAWNGLGESYLIRPGQVLRLTPPPGGSPPVVVRAPPRADPPASGPVASAPARTPAAPAPYRWQWPASGAVVRGFGLPASKGLDIGGALGDPVLAAAPGRVVYSGSALKGYGELVIVKHDDTYLSAYGYNRRRLVQEGDEVRAGDRIGEIGMGPENRPLLHFEIRANGQPVDPARLLPAR